ncbi:helix-turn-helix domain-containing protein [Comamonas kerstersii]|uniref:Helix-turn-helix domain-containing protein n=1 Tax=Comamonas kerstersii TaxID=225992 RepID=A0A6A1R2K9_9BURK|nr:helix-turn-helix transcriptional regulator [Comamonas kerstersii]KAB0586686.1 helix-turn-helix domain-containing protein [Comamonas kerstersii]
MDEFVVRTSDQLSPLLRAFRKQAKLTQMDVAQRLGVTQQTVSVLERNAEAVSAQRLTQLMNILGVEVVLRRKSEVSTEVDKSSGNDTEW